MVCAEALRTAFTSLNDMIAGGTNVIRLIAEAKRGLVEIKARWRLSFSVAPNISSEAPLE